MVHDGDDFALRGADRPRASKEVERGVGIKAALEIESEMEVEQGSLGGTAVGARLEKQQPRR